MTPEQDKKMLRELKSIRRSQSWIVFFLALILVAILIVPTVNAQTITMSNPGGIAERDIAVYWPNGTLYGYYNASSVITLDNTSDYLFTKKPVSSNLLEDPVDWMTNTAFPFVQTNVIGIFVIVLLAAYWKMR